MRAIDVEERRARLARRHRLAPGERASDVVDAARSMVCLHGTDPATVYLSVWARVEGFATADMERALYVERTLVKHLAMRRTLFVFPRATLTFAQAGASERVAGSERRRLVRDVEKAGLHPDGERWLSDAGRQVLAALAGGREATSSQLRDELPVLEGSTTQGQGRSWGGQVPIGPRLLTTLSAAGQIVRACNAGGSSGGSGRPSRLCGPRWPILKRSRSISTEASGTCCPTTSSRPTRSSPGRRCCRRWIRPRWAGPSATGTSAATRRSCSTRMATRGPTVWWDGRIVGGWRQRDTGEVELQMLEDVGFGGLRAVEDEAVRLTAWFDGTRVLPRFPSPLSKAVA